MRRICLLTIAAVLVGLGPLLAADSASLIALPRAASVPNSQSLGFFATAVLAGFEDPAGVLPCFRCVDGAFAVSMGVSAPVAAVQSGSKLTIVVSGDDLSYSGICSFSYSLSIGGTPVTGGSVNGSCYPAVWNGNFPVTAPAPGRYVMTGTIRTGLNLNVKTVTVGQLLVF